MEAASDLIRCEVASLWKLRLRPLNVQDSNGAEHTSPKSADSAPSFPRCRKRMSSEWPPRARPQDLSPKQTVRRRRPRVASTKTSRRENRLPLPRETQPALRDRPRSKPYFSPTFQYAAKGSGRPRAETAAVAARASAGCLPNVDRERHASPRFVCPCAHARRRPRVRRR